MSDMIEWFSKNPLLESLFPVLILILILLLVTMIFIAFLQGRAISFWPPKIGEKPVSNISQIEKVEHGGSNVLHDRRHPELQGLKISNKVTSIIEVTGGPLQGYIYPISANYRDITFGRDESCDLTVPSNLMSRTHFRIRISLQNNSEENSRSYLYELIDAGSSNGTYLNGKRVESPSNLSNGDVFEAGENRFLFNTMAEDGRSA